jgi:ribosomal protein L22
MSAEDEKQADAGETPAAEKPAAEKKPAAAKKAPAQKKAAAAKEPSAEKKAPAAKKAAAQKAPAAAAAEAAEAAEAEKPAGKKAAKKPAAKKAAAKEPAAQKEADSKEPAKKARKIGRGGKAAPEAPRRRTVQARARYVRTSARKARMVCGHIRGKSIAEARAILAFTPREVARDWSKLLESAVANAESNHELLEDDLIVREAYADEGPTIKRFRPRAMGRATPIRKRTSHLTITLTPRPEPGTNKRHG